MSAPTEGARLTVRVDAILSDDLEAMMRTGMTASDAVRTAVSIVAGTYRNAWAMGVCPDGVVPEIRACEVTPYDGPEKHV
ncbi:hypothetical protein [Streptomyces malaysiensis]|uniref:hypothetical protein n=1 Tax=Streptomyces malaysiensis TaxID=92644 RepID=UPI00369B128B